MKAKRYIPPPMKVKAHVVHASDKVDFQSTILTRGDYGRMTATVDFLEDLIASINAEKGWTDDSDNPLMPTVKLALIGTELAEAIEALRLDPIPMSKKDPEITLLEEEIADVFIRLLGFTEAQGIDLVGATVRKLLYNQTRPHKHGGKKF